MIQQVTWSTPRVATKRGNELPASVPLLTPYRMDCNTLDAHAHWAHPLSAADKRKLARLKHRPHMADVAPLIDHMPHSSIKLEQEAVRVRQQVATQCQLPDRDAVTDSDGGTVEPL